MIEYKGEMYELKYNVKRLEVIETALKKPLMAMIQQGFMSIGELKGCVAYAMKKQGADAFMNPKTAMDIVEDLLSEDGAYYRLTNEVAECLQRDCPFFFRAG